MIDVEDVIEDDDLAQDYIIYRSTGSFVGGRWIEGTPVQVEACGTIYVAKEKDLVQVPEADRVSGAMVFYNQAVIYLTRNTPSKGISDKIYWDENYWKVVSVGPYKDYGFYKAIAERITGN
jgi:hypothetical protein